MVDDGDVGGDAYDVDETKDNEVIVTYIDTIAGIARGRFRVSFVVDEPKMYDSSPDCLTFSQGEFEVTFAQ